MLLNRKYCILNSHELFSYPIIYEGGFGLCVINKVKKGVVHSYFVMDRSDIKNTHAWLLLMRYEIIIVKENEKIPHNTIFRWYSQCKEAHPLSMIYI